MSSLTSRGASKIWNERLRQQMPVKKGGEGYTERNDEQYEDGQLIMAAIAYCEESLLKGNGKWKWPGRRLGWDEFSFKPKDPISNLVRAGALIAAEIDRLLEKEQGEQNDKN